MPRCGCGHRLSSEDFEFEDDESDDEYISTRKKYWEQEDQTFVSTRSSKFVEEKLRTCERVVILGEAGCGKSATALNIALKHSSRSRKWKIVMVKNLRDIENAPVRTKNVIFIINDPIGKTALDEQSCRMWYLQKQLLNQYHLTNAKDERKVNTPKVIVTCRSNLIEDVGCHFKQFTLIKMDEKDFELTKEEKIRILKKYIDYSTFTDTDINNLLETEKSFPLISELVSGNKNFEDKIHGFYREPFKEIKKEILSLKDSSTEKFLCLFLLNVCGNQLTKEHFEDREKYVPIENLHSKERNAIVNDDSESQNGNDEEDINVFDNEDEEDKKELDPQMIVDLLKAVGLPESISKKAIFDSLRDFRGHYFVKRIKNVFQVTNDSFLMALNHIFCTSFPEQFLKYCPSSYFCTFTISSNGQSDIIPNVQLQDSYINSFVDRIQEDIKAGKFLDIFLSPWIRDARVVSSLIVRLESMPYGEMLQMTLNSKLNVPLQIANSEVQKEIAGFSRLDLIELCKEISPIILSLVLNLDELFLAMFNLIRKNGSGPEYLTSAPLMSACCVNGRADLVRLILDNVDCRTKSWSKDKNIHSVHIAANFLNIDALRLVLDGEHDVNITTRTMKSPFFLAASAGQYALQNIRWTIQELSNSSKRYEEFVEENRLKILTLLRQRGADVNNHPPQLPSALAYSCQNAHKDSVHFMVESGANVKETNDDKISALHFASEVGNIEIVQMLLDNGADISASTSAGLTPLYLASLSGHADVVERYLSKGISLELKEESENNPFFVACKHGQKRIVQMFLEYDPFVNCKSPDGTSALLAAVDYGQRDIVELLLKHGADANIVQTNSKISPLYSAASSGYDGIVEVLLKSDARVDMRTHSGDIPLNAASKNGHHSVVQTLLENGANVNHFTLVRRSALLDAAENGHHEIVLSLLHKKAEVNSLTKKEKRSPLMQASSQGYENIVCELLLCGACVDESDQKGNTSLYLACKNGHINVVKILLANKADANLCNKNGFTPLYIASRFGHHTIVQELFRNDVKLFDKISPGKKQKRKHALFPASRYGHYKTVEILLQNGANVNIQTETTPLIVAARKGRSKIVKILLKFEADVNVSNEDDENALHCACFKGHTDIVKMLLNQGMDINCHVGYTPLQQALFGERLRTALFLLDHGANANIVTYGTSALYLACEAGFADLVNILLERNVDVNPKRSDKSPTNSPSPDDSAAESLLPEDCPSPEDSSSDSFVPDDSLLPDDSPLPDDSSAESPLSAAVKNGYLQITKVLLRHGANIVKTNSNGGESLLTIAVKNKTLEIVKLLIEYGANVNEQDKHGTAPLHASAYYTDNLDFMAVLLNSNADTNVRNYTGTTPLMMTLHKNPETKERVQALLTSGADINAHDNFGCSPLHNACLWSDKHNVLPYLLENGADINAQDDNGETALHVSCFQGFLQNVKTLVRFGADINLCKKDGRSPLDICVEMGYTNIQNFLTQNADDARHIEEKKTSSKSVKNIVSVPQRELVLARRNPLAPCLTRRNKSVKLRNTWQPNKI